MTNHVQTVVLDKSHRKTATGKEVFSHIDVVELDSAQSIPPISSPITTLASKHDSNITEAAPLNISDSSSTLSTININAAHLISSPYSDFANQLVLSDLETPCRLFAFALTALKPIREDYATAPYLESFNWPEVFALLRSLCDQTGWEWKRLSFYAVIFRSQLMEGIDRDRLGLLDQKSHEEACASGGLLKYWFGGADKELKNLATCLWRSCGDAATGGAGPWHAQARMAARTMYKSINFYTHQLVVEDGAESWRLEDHVEQHIRQ